MCVKLLSVSKTKNVNAYFIVDIKYHMTKWKNTKHINKHEMRENLEGRVVINPITLEPLFISESKIDTKHIKEIADEKESNFQKYQNQVVDYQ